MQDDAPEIHLRTLTLRDPAGSLYEVGDELIRIVHPHAESDFELSSTSKAMQGFVDSGHIISHWKVKEPHRYSFLLSANSPSTQNPCLIAQTKLPFVNYPHEWSPEMLRKAAVLTLDLAEKLLDDGLGLKDASPYNILYSHSKPVFVDILSVESRNPHDSLWLAYSQFLRCFINPLVLQSYFGIPFSKTFLLNPEGVSPQEIYRQCGWVRRFSPRFFALATLPTFLERKKRTIFEPSDLRQLESSSERASFILRFLFKRLRRTLLAIPKVSSSQSRFINYMEKTLPYSPDQFKTKESFVSSALSNIRPLKVLDVGCNDGYFSRMAASLGAEVVAIDSDPSLVDKLWSETIHSQLKILPLVVNISHPSPATGWNNEEHRSFLERSRGKFDCVLMLALLHHIMTTDGIPLNKILEFASRLTTRWLIVEWISPHDPMFAQLALGKSYAHLGEVAFQQECAKHFKIILHQVLPGGLRSLYLLEKQKITAD